MNRSGNAAVRIADIVRTLEKLAPPILAEPWDNVGLQVGRLDAAVTKAMVCLDVNENAVDRAASKGCGLIIAHHPLFLKDAAAITNSNGAGKAALKAAERGVAVYIAHTNLDKAPGGINDVLADLFGLRGTEALESGEHLYKLVVFVPGEALAGVQKALGDTGAGMIGLYSHCSFSALGRGSFMPLPGARPAEGEVGVVNAVDEYRLEVEVGASELEAVESAMLAAHPYEEVAFDVYELVNKDRRCGLGRIGELPEELLLDELIARCRQKFGRELRVAGRIDKVGRLAVCGGSGGSLIGAAHKAGADAFVTGDVKYHDALKAADLGLAIIDAGHDGTEGLAVELIAGKLREILPIEVIGPPKVEPVWRVSGEGGRQ